MDSLLLESYKEALSIVIEFGQRCSEIVDCQAYGCKIFFRVLKVFLGILSLNDFFCFDLVLLLLLGILVYLSPLTIPLD